MIFNVSYTHHKISLMLQTLFLFISVKGSLSLRDFLIHRLVFSFLRSSSSIMACQPRATKCYCQSINRVLEFKFYIVLTKLGS